MSIIEIFFVAVALSMDALAVSIAASMVKENNKNKLFLLSFTFALFQMLMPVLGDLLGNIFAYYIQTYSRFVIFAILLVIGINMIFEGYKSINNPQHPKQKLTAVIMVTQAFATSIDAFAVGIGFKVSHTNILLAVSVIFLVTLTVCTAGVMIGKTTGEKLGNKAEIFGGIILCVIALKTVFIG